MIAPTPVERVAAVLTKAGYKRLDLPLRVAGLDFDVASAFIGVGHSADLVVVGDMAEAGDRKVVQQVEGVARALDVMRSLRPLTTVVVGPRPTGKTLEALTQVGRMLSVDEAIDSAELIDRLAVLLPLEVRRAVSDNYDLGAMQEIPLPDDHLSTELVIASEFSEEAVQSRFHAALNAIFTTSADVSGDAT